MTFHALGVVTQEAASQTERSPLLPPLYDIVWSGIIFALILGVIVFVALPKYYALADERAKKLEEGINAAEQAKRDMEENAKVIEQELVEAREKATVIRDEAHAQAKQIVSQAQEKANEEAKRIAASAARQLEAQKQTVSLELRKDVGALAVELAEKIVGEQLKDTELSARVVDRFIDDLEKQPSN